MGQLLAVDASARMSVRASGGQHQGRSAIRWRTSAAASWY